MGGLSYTKRREEQRVPAPWLSYTVLQYECAWGTLTVHFERVFCPDAVQMCGLPSCHLNLSVWCSTGFCSETCNFWSFLFQPIVPYSWMCRVLNHKILTFWVTALCVSQYHKIFLHKVFWKINYVTAPKNYTVLMWGIVEVYFLECGWGSSCALKNKSIKPAHE